MRRWVIRRYAVDLSDAGSRCEKYHSRPRSSQRTQVFTSTASVGFSLGEKKFKRMGAVLIPVTLADPSWSVEFRSRDAMLWIGPAPALAKTPGGYQDLLQCMTTNAWAAVYVDSSHVLPSDLSRVSAPLSRLEIRVLVSEAGSDHLPSNRLPVYFLRGPNDNVGPNSHNDPAGQFLRYSMLQRAGEHADVFAIGINSADDLKTYILTQRINAFSRGFSENLLQYAVGRQLDLLDDESIEQAQRAFVAANYDFKVLVQAVAGTQSFRAASE